MKEQKFNWISTNNLGLFKLLLATFVPSLIAFTGFHYIVPKLVENEVPVLLSYGITASSMLFLLLTFTIIILIKEARLLKVKLIERMMINKIDKKNTIISVIICLVTLVLTIILKPLSTLIIDLFNFEVPNYLPYFLNPKINPATSDILTLSSGISLSGRWDIFAILVTTLILNILTEELYFRAWMLPKLSKYGKASWIINGLLFAFYHTFQIWLLPVIIVASLGFAYICYKTKSIIPAFIFHIVINIFSVISLFPLFK